MRVKVEKLRLPKGECNLVTDAYVTDCINGEQLTAVSRGRGQLRRQGRTFMLFGFPPNTCCPSVNHL